MPIARPDAYRQYRGASDAAGHAWTDEDENDFSGWFNNSADSGAYQGPGYGRSWDELMPDVEARFAQRMQGGGGDPGASSMGWGGGGMTGGAAGGWGGSADGNPAPGLFSERFSFDPSKIRENPSYQVKISDIIRGVNRGAGAQGLSFTNAAREELGTRLGDLATDEIDAEYGRQLGAFTTNRDTFDANWGRGRTGVLDAWGRDDSLANRERLNTNDQWQRGSDLWGMQRTDRQDSFDNNFRLSDLVLSRRPRPA